MAIPTEVVLTVASVLLSAFAAGFSGLLRRRTKILERAVNELEEKGEDAASVLRPGSAIRMYHYLDSSAVMRLYDQTRNSDLVLTGRTVDHTGEGELSVGAAFKWISPSYRRKRALVRSETFSRDVSADVAMPTVERKLIENDQISVIDIDQAIARPPFKLLLQELSAVRRRTGFDVVEEVQVDLESKWLKFQVERGIAQLAALTGFVALSGDFQVEVDVRGDVILSRRTVIGDDAVEVRVFCSKENLAPNGQMVAVHPG